VNLEHVITLFQNDERLSLNEWLILLKSRLAMEKLSQEYIQKIVAAVKLELQPLNPVENGQLTDLSISLDFDETDELYISNAGLVILWPFLKHFFAHLDLLADTQFKGKKARMRAIYLLQFLVDGQAEKCSEYMLPLNKILCSLDWTEITEPPSEIAGSEMEESLHFLEEIIRQAPILREMSVQGFRDTFLCRRGVLRSRDGGWLLQVERETYDVVLDRFPWSWQWIKLPWMETALRVEW